MKSFGLPLLLCGNRHQGTIQEDASLDDGFSEIDGCSNDSTTPTPWNYIQNCKLDSFTDNPNCIVRQLYNWIVFIFN